MKETVLNTFAVIGIVTTFVLACSAVLDDEETTVTNNETVASVSNESTASDNTTSNSTTSNSSSSNNTTTNNTSTIAQSAGKYQLTASDGALFLLNSETAEVKQIHTTTAGSAVRWYNPGNSEWYNHQ